MKINIYYSWKG